MRFRLWLCRLLLPRGYEIEGRPDWVITTPWIASGDGGHSLTVNTGGGQTYYYDNVTIGGPPNAP